MKGILFIVFMLPGFAFAQSVTPITQTTIDPQTTPACHCPAQCDAMWAQATQDVEQASGMRLRIATPSLLETYPSNNANRQTGMVVKTPLGGESYQIELTLEPWAPGQRDAQSTMQANISNFNIRLNGIASTTTCH